MFLCAILDALIAFGEIADVILLEVQTHTAFRGSYSIGCALATLQLLGKDFCWSNADFQPFGFCGNGGVQKLHICFCEK
ncbi:unknown [Firmicutes bacterium CAG:137]|nr:unknown [Firmicutes bacterium CAG:137]